MAVGDKTKVGLYLSIELIQQLKRLGKIRVRALSNLCEEILQREVKVAIAEGEIPPPTPDEEVLRQFCDRYGVEEDEILEAISQIKSQADTYGICQ